MQKEAIKLGTLKFGCIGMTPLLDFILDERADRTDLKVSGFSTGAKLELTEVEEATRAAIASQPDLVILVCPNAKLPGPSRALKMLEEASIYTVVITDTPGRRAFYAKTTDGQNEIRVSDKLGFIIVSVDPMIGARREFLDATEMAIFNSDIIRVLAGTGVFRFIVSVIDDLISSLKEGKEPEMPTVTLDSENAIENASFQNPYARAKALAALKMSESVAQITTQACFKETETSKYVSLVAAGHELMRAAARLVDEAREIEKCADSILRTPHSSNGKLRHKRRLGEKLS